MIDNAIQRWWLSRAVRASRSPAGPAALLSLFLIVLGASRAAGSSSLCVSPKGKHGCFTTIQAAINAVSAPNTTIQVRRGTYTASCGGAACSVAAITAAGSNAASLTGLILECADDDDDSAVLDATNLDHAVYVSGVNQVTIDGCVEENAGREGILVENSSNVTVSNNEVANNDRALSFTAPCPTFLPPGTPLGGGKVPVCCADAFAGGPGNFPLDTDDCGEAIHLRSVTASVVQGNSVHDNVGGILLTDETGVNENNLIESNLSENNTLDCGITLPSHLACTAGSTDATGCTLAGPGAGGVFQGFGVNHNVVADNVTIGNGASGVGVFANPGIPPGAATKAIGNVISGNLVQDNGQPGVAIHSHAANADVSHNIIVGNTVSGNGGDEEAEGSSPPNTGIEVLSNGMLGAPFSAAAPIIGTTIFRNEVSGEDIDVWVGNTATDARVFLNDLADGTIGVDNAGTGTVVATDNFWGCPDGPGAPGCSSTAGTVISSPFLSQPVNSQENQQPEGHHRGKGHSDHQRGSQRRK
jgi:parallel beta-helix repeat protein